MYLVRQAQKTEPKALQRGRDSGAVEKCQVMPALPTKVCHENRSGHFDGVHFKAPGFTMEAVSSHHTWLADLVLQQSNDQRKRIIAFQTLRRNSEAASDSNS